MHHHETREENTTHLTTSDWTPSQEVRRLTERYAERLALRAVRGANFTQSLVMNKIPVSIEVLDEHGTPFTVQASALFDERTWQKCLAQLARPLDLCRLTESAEVLIKHYRSWLLTSHTKRYRQIGTAPHLAWLEQVAGLAVMRKIMEAKYEAYLFEQRDAFADPWVEQEMMLIMLLGQVAKECAKVIHHIKDPEQAQPLLEQLYRTHASYVQKRSPIAREDLPPLPTGMSLAWLAPLLVTATSSRSSSRATLWSTQDAIGGDA